jgi:hypothetical protein
MKMHIRSTGFQETYDSTLVFGLIDGTSFWLDLDRYRHISSAGEKEKSRIFDLLHYILRLYS